MNWEGVNQLVWSGAEAVRKALSQGLSVTGKDETGWTVLHHVAFAGDPESLRLLLEAGAEVDARDKEGRTPLHIALGTDLPRFALDKVRLLLDANADARAKTKNGEPTLHRLLKARYSGVSGAFGSLRYVGVSAEARERWSRDFAPVVELLLTRGADLGAKDRSGKSILDLVTQTGDKEFLDALQSFRG